MTKTKEKRGKMTERGYGPGNDNKKRRDHASSLLPSTVESSLAIKCVSNAACEGEEEDRGVQLNYK